MTPEQWQKAKEIFDHALAAGADERGSLVAEACGGDDEVRREVEELLANHDRAGEFLEPDVSRLVHTDVGLPKLCPACGARADENERFCPHDGEVLVDDPEALVGRTLADLYKVEAVLGRGGMGAVYRARHVLLRDVVAIKILPAGVRDNAAWLRRFVREGQAARRLRHPNAVAVHDLRTDAGGLVFMVMEYVEGETLRAHMERHGRLSPDDALAILEPIAGALDAAHAAGIVHRDLKPENVMLGRDADGRRVVKLLDLGVAKMRAIADDGATPAHATEPGLFLGTPKYMSPEQWGQRPDDGGDDDVDGRADVYALGVMAYEMVCGAHPFPGGDAYELRRQHTSFVPLDAAEVVPSLPADFGGAIGRAMAKPRADRQPTAGAFATELRDALDAVPTAGLPRATETAAVRAETQAFARPDPPTEVVAGPPEPAARPWARWVAPAAVALALVGVGITWSFWPKPSAAPVAPALPPATTPVRVEAIRYSVDLEKQTSPAADGVPAVAPGESFRFRFRAPEGGYLYVVAPGPGEVPTSFLTEQPVAGSGVSTNRVEAGRDFLFPGEPAWLRIDDGREPVAYTIVLSREPLVEPAFLAGRAGRQLSAEERRQLDAFRDRYPPINVERRHDRSGFEVVTVPEERPASDPFVFELTLFRR